jgi:SPP1 gp7 family putative phage head morphogenesis protein
MPNTQIDEVETEIERLGVIISASETWSRSYKKDPTTHAKLLKQEAKLARIMRGYLRGVAERSTKYVNWMKYQSDMIKKGFDVNVMVDDGEFDDTEVDILINALHDPLIAGMVIGAEAGQTIYDRDLGIGTTNTEILKAARKYSGELVTQISNTTKNKIKQSIETSLHLGEDYQTAVERLNETLKDYRRAEMIARTEAVNAYNKGLLSFADQSGATQKEWQADGATDECDTLDGQIIGIDESFDYGGEDGPPLHPNCRCGLRLIYDIQAQADALNAELDA